MSSRGELGLYFKSQPEFKRIFEEMRRKWESLGRTAGKVTLAKGTEKERKALERFLGRALGEGRISFSLTEFEKALGETRYGQISLKELLEEYFGEPVVGNQERRQRKQDRETEFWDGIEQEMREAEADGEKRQAAEAGGRGRPTEEGTESGDRERPTEEGTEPGDRERPTEERTESGGRERPTEEDRRSGDERQAAAEAGDRKRPGEETETGEILSWIRQMREQKNQGYAALMKEYQKSEESARERIREVARCLRMCPPPGGQESAGEYRWQGIRLAVLAARATGNPHALDRQNTTGTLLSYVLCRRDGSEFPVNARQWKELYDRNGIWVDELSSTVAAYGVHLMTEEGLHPAYEGYCSRREPCVISLANLACGIRAFGESERIYVVENEMVFSELVERLSGDPVTLLCTSGQPRTAAYRLMDLLCEGNERISFWYAGDMDPEGLDIAQRIYNSFPGRVHIWRMSGEDYERTISRETVSERRMEMMKNLTHHVLRETAERIREQKRAGYQEMLIGEMVRDVKNIELVKNVW